MVSDRYGNGVEAYARRALLLARADFNQGYLTRVEFARVTESLQDIVLQYEVVKRKQEKTPKA